jgi:hypothetical protein
MIILKQALRAVIFSVSIFFLFQAEAFSKDGDTVKIQTFTFGSPQDAWFVFPKDTVKFEKILMRYTLKCNPAQNPPCGEWDYLTYSYLFDHTGKQDSVLEKKPAFTVDGNTPSTFSYITSPSYIYNVNKQFKTRHLDTSAYNTYILGAGNASSNLPFGSGAPKSRTQYLWRAAELQNSGVQKGDITDLQFHVLGLGTEMRNLTIKIKTVTQDSISGNLLPDAGFTTVYMANTKFTDTGWQTIPFLINYNWDGTSNLLVEISYDNNSAGNDNTIAADTNNFSSGIYMAGNNRVFSFSNYGYIDVPVNNISKLDSFVTIAFWAYGDPAKQPMESTIFAGTDNNGNRIINGQMPWGDSRFYWDAGTNGGSTYDRVAKTAIATEIKGQWNYWTLTKNVATGSMKIYLNGQLWTSGTGLKRRMYGITKFRIGQGFDGSKTYEGKIDEFAVWNTELSAAEIQANMYKSPDLKNKNLLLYYNADNNNLLQETDVSGNSNTANLVSVGKPFIPAAELFTNPVNTTLRPQVKFGQGIFTSKIESIYSIDSTVQKPLYLVEFSDAKNPVTATDTQLVWAPYYRYTFDAKGKKTDSTLIAAEKTLTQQFRDYYRKYERINRFELGRYITPYGNGLDLGNGFTWTFDVSDYRTLLADSVHLAAGNWQELLNMEFWMIKGTPPRDVLGIQNLWNGNFNYGVIEDPIDNHLKPLSIPIPSKVKAVRLKSRITGHGFGGNENCSEFCAKTHSYKVDGTQRFSKLVWRDNCAKNPVYPQGGTWVYQRANWCPGAEVWTYDFELTPYITPGKNALLDHDVEAYEWDGAGSTPYYAIEDQLVTYGAPNFTLDAAVDEILAPTTEQLYARMNPVCSNPIIRIKNTGSTTLTSLEIRYGMPGADQSVYNWTGNLKFLETAEVNLGAFAWNSSGTFMVNVSKPNGGNDEYSANNTFYTKVNIPPVMPEKFIIELKTNNNPDESAYTLKDASGKIILSKDNLDANTTYKDTVTLNLGCYEFRLKDIGEDGLKWWANPDQGSGLIRFKKVENGVVFKNFNTDFGAEVFYPFTVGKLVGVKDYLFESKTQFNIYPNPSGGLVAINLDFAERKTGVLEIIDITGKKVYSYDIKNTIAEGLDLDLKHFPAGIYMAVLKVNGETQTRKFLITK